ncbi:valyl-tRNA synthetase [Mesotoga sp. HF07.pep.5.2.highcov]|jgi:valyl-tRNA synthetase|uniref:valine--tRNA ligase n=1 Tax=unclassified Mesotoga TaxID=1184398 RepID=UPI000C177695|nr:MULTISPECIES: valine--tRNA ligase [unclassified Mesotoga]PIJ62464.1 valyl-tRNA synthetase [Mesotoga sp. H07.pep.5.3]RLL86870.1 valyl-tRNA synthetase [Mesotoga sp. H07pep.5.4]RLL91762.1 valyl-tRNA synthetase [Mesotoga sp. HF07.pep.5.2.highcov]
MKELSTRYNPSDLEEKWYSCWKEGGFFEPKGSGEPFTIMIPPPNITAPLHMGHALNLVIQDIIIRFKRMKGYRALWVPGEDHAGIATQNAVEKDLAKKGTNRKELGRERFLETTWNWAKEYRQRIREQIEAMGCSVDWSRERFTMDEGLSEAVRKAFVMLYKEGLIYRGKYIVNWCPRCSTVLSDEEVEHEDEKGAFYHIKYPIKDSDEYVIIATTRPETMLADTAVAVYPSDDRYEGLVGKTVILPLMNREIPIIQDRYVDPSFGTGALKVTPAHDPNDFQIGLRHGLEVIEVLDKDARINENGGKYKGLDRYEARKQIVKDLEEQGFLIKVEPMVHAVGRCYRCETVVEPCLSDQWYVKVGPLAEKAIEAVEEGSVTFFPETWKKVYLNWMNEIRDWCISRQLWWGHRVPVWYCDDCNEVIVEEQDPSVCPKCGSKNIRQDEDVLDTWFSSQLWPFTTLGWPEKTEDLESFYPTSVLVTAFDIIFFWVARMIMAGYHFMGEKPFNHVYITRLIRDKNGRKMSKSLGNGIDPLDVIREHGTDAMRFTLAILAAQNHDIKLDVRFFDIYKKFANKIWNAARFALLNMEGFEKVNLDEEELAIEDRWILSRLAKSVKAVEESIDGYDFPSASKMIYSFFWNEFCDWYIESTKPRLNREGRSRIVAQNVLVRTLDASLRMLHPFMPYITEELWQNLPGSDGLLITARWPEFDESSFDNPSEVEYSRIMDMVRGVRNIKAEMNIPPSSKTAVYYIGEVLNQEVVELVSHLSNSNEIDRRAEKTSGSVSAWGDAENTLYVVLGEIDTDAEIERLTGKLEKERVDLARTLSKLENGDFIRNAPEEVITENRERLATSKDNIRRIEKIIEDLK